MLVSDNVTSRAPFLEDPIYPSASTNSSCVMSQHIFPDILKKAFLTLKTLGSIALGKMVQMANVPHSAYQYLPSLVAWSSSHSHLRSVDLSSDHP